MNKTVLTAGILALVVVVSTFLITLPKTSAAVDKPVDEYNNFACNTLIHIYDEKCGTLSGIVHYRECAALNEVINEHCSGLGLPETN
jgi:hypothetical protein